MKPAQTLRSMIRTVWPVLVAMAVGLCCAAIILKISGESPVECFRLILKHALLTPQGWAYVAYHATLMIFVGLAVALPLQAGLFNIGVEGQLYAGALGCTLMAFAARSWPAWMAVPACLLSGALAGALAGAIPGWMKARRGVHEVITTLLLNFCVLALVNFLTAGPLKDPGDPGQVQMTPQTRIIPVSCQLPSLADAFPGLVPASLPLNSSSILAILLVVAIWAFLFRTRTGFLMRVLRQGALQVRMAGGHPDRLIVLSLSLAGAMAGLLCSSEVMGYRHRLMDGFSAGLGYQGIAVALVARNHPLWIPLAGLFFGVLQKGCSVLDLYTGASKEIAVVLQAVVILALIALEALSREKAK